MIKAKVTSKNQLTIPKKVIDYLEIMAADKVSFSLEQIGNKKCVMMEKLEGECPVCNGDGHIERVECIICRGKGNQVPSISVFNEINNMAFDYAKKLKLTYCISTQCRSFPIIELKSSKIPSEILARFNDYYQFRLIKEESKELKEEGIYNAHSNKVYVELLDSMKTEEGKKLVSYIFAEQFKK